MQSVFAGTSYAPKYVKAIEKDLTSTLQYFPDLRPTRCQDPTQGFIVFINGTISIDTRDKNDVPLPVCISLPKDFPLVSPKLQITAQRNLLVPSTTVNSNGDVQVPNIYTWEFKKSTLSNFIQEISLYFSRNSPITPQGCDALISQKRARAMPQPQPQMQQYGMGPQYGTQQMYSQQMYGQNQMYGTNPMMQSMPGQVYGQPMMGGMQGMMYGQQYPQTFGMAPNLEQMKQQAVIESQQKMNEANTSATKAAEVAAEYKLMHAQLDLAVATNTKLNDTIVQKSQQLACANQRGIPDYPIDEQLEMNARKKAANEVQQATLDALRQGMIDGSIPLDKFIDETRKVSTDYFTSFVFDELTMRQA